MNPDPDDLRKARIEDDMIARAEESAERRLATTIVIRRCACRGGVTDTDIVDWLSTANWSYRSRADGSVVFERPWALSAPNLREAVTWMIQNGKK